MLNNSSLVGRLTIDPKAKEFEDKNRLLVVVLAVTRNFKNHLGKYDADYIMCKIWGNKTKTLENHCKKGDIIGFTGRLASKSLENEKGEKYNEQYFAVDKITLFPKAMNEIPYEIKKAPRSAEIIKPSEAEAKLEEKKALEAENNKDEKTDTLPF